MTHSQISVTSNGSNDGPLVQAAAVTPHNAHHLTSAIPKKSLARRFAEPRATKQAPWWVSWGRNPCGDARSFQWCCWPNPSHDQIQLGMEPLEEEFQTRTCQHYAIWKFKSRFGKSKSNFLMLEGVNVWLKSKVRWSWRTAATVWSNAAKSRVLTAVRWAVIHALGVMNMPGV